MKKRKKVTKIKNFNSVKERGGSRQSKGKGSIVSLGLFEKTKNYTDKLVL